MKKKINGKNKAGLGILVFALFCVSIMLSTLSFQEVVESPVVMRNRIWQDMGDEAPTGDESGFLGFRVYPNQGDPATTYATNLTDGNSYEYQTTIDSEATGETPYLTAVDFIVNLRVNDTVGYNTSSSEWETGWIYMNMSVDFDWSTDVPWTTMTLVEVTNNSNFAWYQAYLNNGGSGYEYAKDEDAQQNINGTFYW